MVQKMVQKEDGTVTASHQLADAVVPFHLRHDGARLRNLGLLRVRATVMVKIRKDPG